MYSMDGDILETVLLQDNMIENGHSWSLGPKLFRIMGLPDSEIQTSNVVQQRIFGHTLSNYLLWLISR